MPSNCLPDKSPEDIAWIDALSDSLVVSTCLSALISSRATDPTAQAFPELDAEIHQQKKAGHSLVYPVVKKSVKPVYPSMMAAGNVWSVMKVGPEGKVEEVKIVGQAPTRHFPDAGEDRFRSTRWL